MTPEKMEKKQRAKIVKVARSYLGAKQGSAKHKRLINIFNTVKPDGCAMTYTAYWCAATVSAWAIEAFGKDKAKKHFPLSCNCDRIITLAKSMKIWQEDDAYKPEPGDWLLYDWDEKTGKGNNKNTPNHVGLVEKCEKGKITVIEGNYHQEVKERVIVVDGQYIRGFVTPKYDKIVQHSSAWYFRKTTEEIIKYMNAHGFKYSNTGNATTWDGAKKKKTSNCATMISYALQESGFLKPGQGFYCKGEKIVYTGKGTKAQLEKVAKITHPNKKPQKLKLKKGDICGYAPHHTQEYGGKNTKDIPKWYSWGPGDVGDKQPKVKKKYTDEKILTRIRLK